jgi:hypothetical protein
VADAVVPAEAFASVMELLGEPEASVAALQGAQDALAKPRGTT